MKTVLACGSLQESQLHFRSLWTTLGELLPYTEGKGGRENKTQKDWGLSP